MGYVIRGRTNHKSAYPDSPLFSLWLSHSLLMCSPRGFSAMLGHLHASLIRVSPLPLNAAVLCLEWVQAQKRLSACRPECDLMMPYYEVARSHPLFAKLSVATSRTVHTYSAMEPHLLSQSLRHSRGRRKEGRKAGIEGGREGGTTSMEATALTAIGYGRRRKNEGRHAIQPRTCAVGAAETGYSVIHAQLVQVVKGRALHTLNQVTKQTMLTF